MIRASHIVKNVDENTTEEAALAAIREIQPRLTADNFAELANEFSDCRGNGGDLGYFPRGQMVDEFDDVVFALEPGQTSDVFRTPFGYHIARVVDRRPAGVRPFPEVKQEIEDLLFRQKLHKALDELIGRLRAQADIQQVRQKVSS
jgi:parvulin-like peptidyl-prolyl isomerase